MSVLIKAPEYLRKLKLKLPLQLTRGLAAWNKDYKPGPYPKTLRERKIAAAKYNLFPEEYETYPDDGLGYGDYPKLKPGLGAAAKDPFYPYDFPEHKRNFNEPLHINANMYGEDRYSIEAPFRYSKSHCFLAFFGVMTACFLIFYFLDNKKTFRPVAVKQYPQKGAIHYTFNIEDGEEMIKKKNSCSI